MDNYNVTSPAIDLQSRMYLVIAACAFIFQVTLLVVMYYG